MNNEMSFRFYDENDYSHLSAWMIGHGKNAIPRPYLPRHGLVIESNGTPAAMGFIFATDSCIAIFEYIVTNPSLSSFVRSDSLDMLISNARTIAKELGFKIVFSAIGDRGLAKRMSGSGFETIGTDVTNLMGRV